MTEPAPSPDLLRILSVGPLTWEEGYEYALEAVALLAAGGVACRYRIVGAGEFAVAVHFARRQLGLDRLVEIAEPDPQELREHHLWADAFLSAAVAPRPPEQFVAAQAAGLPLVVTETPPAGPEGALVVPRRDPRRLADALGRLAADPELRLHLGRAGRRALDV